MSSVKDDGARGPPEGRKMLLGQYLATNMSGVSLVISIINAHEKCLSAGQDQGPIKGERHNRGECICLRITGTSWSQDVNNFEMKPHHLI